MNRDQGGLDIRVWAEEGKRGHVKAGRLERAREICNGTMRVGRGHRESNEAGDGLRALEIVGESTTIILVFVGDSALREKRAGVVFCFWF